MFTIFGHFYGLNDKTDDNMKVIISDSPYFVMALTYETDLKLL